MFLFKENSIDAMIEKAFDTGDLASGGLLNPDQAARFVTGTIDQSVILQDARRVPMRANKRIIDKITYGSKILQAAPSTGTAPSTTSEPVTSKVTLDAKEVIVALDIGYDSLEDNIEGQTMMDTILMLTDKQVAFELDELLLYGDTAGATSTVLDLLDGLFKQTTTNVSDAGLVTCDADVMFDALKILPGKYLDQEANWRYYTSHNARLDYIKSLGDKAVDSAFRQYLVQQSGPVSYNGVPLQKVGAIKTESLTVGTDTADGSRSLLVNPRNIVFGIHRDITYEFERVPRKRIIEVTMTMRMDVKLEEELATVKINNIKHSV